MNPRTIHITENDLSRLRTTIVEAMRGKYRNSAYLHDLQAELDRAEVVSSAQIPPDVITMNTRVLLRDLDANEELDLRLCYPEEMEGEGSVSILAPIGTAILGYRVGDELDWQTPGGVSRLRVEKILYQPESSGDYS